MKAKRHVISKTIIAVGVIIAIGLLPKSAKSQQVEVNHFTGAPMVSIPVHTINVGEIEVPITLIYQTSGIKVKEVEGSAGMGWHLEAGGEITRELRDLPDDINSGSDASARKGWLYSNMATKINSFVIQNDNSASTHADELADITYIDNNFSTINDLQPDIFNVRAPGLSCRLVFNSTGQLVPIEDIDIKVTHTMSSGINSIIITNDQGIRYEFSLSSSKSKSTYSASPSTISFFKRDYELFKNSISFKDRWYLVSMKDINQKAVNFVYQDNPESTTLVKPIELYIGTSTTKTLQYTVTETHKKRKLVSIDFYRSYEVFYPEQITFSYRSNPSTDQNYVYDIIWKKPTLENPNNVLQTWYLSYLAAGHKDDLGQYKRHFLTSFRSPGMHNPVRFNFAYEGIYHAGGSNYNVDLPDSASVQLDRWGYYNAQGYSLLPAYYINPSFNSYEHLRTVISPAIAGNYPYSTNGSHRNVNQNTIKTGMLNKITSTNGGTTLIGYESNEYYDPNAVAAISGGGVRVKSITDQDLPGGAADRVRVYDYTDPNTGQSSGVPLSIPSFAFIRAYTGSGTNEAKWKASIVRADESFTKSTDRIVYSHVKMSEDGRGDKRYSFNIPANYFSPDTLDLWDIPFSYIARPTNTFNGLLKGAERSYPFSPATNYSFAQGQLLTLEELNESGQIVQKSDYEYLPSGSAVQIPALGLETMGTSTAYSKYYINARSVFRPSKQTVTSYDVASGTEVKNITNIYYGVNHNNPTRVETFESDGTIRNMHSKFIKDYSYGSVSGTTATSMKDLSDHNKNVLVEAYQTITRSGTTKTIAADLVKFKPAPVTGVTIQKPSEQLSFRSAGGITNFQVSTITGGNLTNDSRYWTTINYTHYDYWGNATSWNDGKGNVRTQLYSYDDPYATINGATPEEVAINIFESSLAETNYGLTNGDPRQYSEGHTGRQSLSLLKNKTLTRTIQKKAYADRYIFMVRVRATVAGNLTVKATGTGSQVQTRTITFPNTNNDWVLLKTELPVSTMTSSFVISVMPNQDIHIDDIMFFPETATLAMSTLDEEMRLVTSTTDMNGKVQFFNYDQWGRLTQTLNDEKDITMNYSYVNYADTVILGSITHSGIAVDKVIDFDVNVNASHKEGLNYVWDFGDGSPPISQTTPEVSHVYDAVGTYTVSVTVESPFLNSTVQTNKTIEVTPYDNTVNVAVQILGTISKVKFINGGYTSSFTGSSSTGVGQAMYTIEVLAGGAYHPYHQPNGFKSITIAVLDDSNNTIVSRCVNAGDQGLYVFSNVDLAGAAKIIFRTEYDFCTLIPIE